MNWVNIVAVFIGSGFGGVCRYLVSKVIQTNVAQSTEFPWGTFAVNVTGCFLIGLFYGLIDRHPSGLFMSQQVRLLLTVGFCGGFTTFSTFINENYLLFQSSHPMTVLGYLLISVITGFIMLFAGNAIARP